jgi:hypothetical protein
MSELSKGIEDQERKQAEVMNKKMMESDFVFKKSSDRSESIYRAVVVVPRKLLGRWSFGCAMKFS